MPSHLGQLNTPSPSGSVYKFQRKITQQNNSTTVYTLTVPVQSMDTKGATLITFVMTRCR